MELRELHTFGERLRWVVEQHLGVTHTEFAQRLGVKRSQLSAWVAREDAPSEETVERLSEASGVPRAWLRYGAGSPTENGATPTAAPVGEEYIYLPRYDVQAEAGTGVPVVTEEVADWVSFKVEWLRRTLGLSPAHLALIEAVGDSMKPTIEDGDLLLLDVSEPKLRGNGIYVIGVGDALLVKRVAIRLSGDGIVISSDNEQYAHTRQELTREEMGGIRIIGRVVWIGGRV